MGLTVEELRKQWVGTVFDRVEVEARAEDMAAFARACGETDPRYLDPAHPDFQAPVNFTTKYHGARLLPPEFPAFDRRRMIDAGKAIEWKAPLRPGGRLTARSSLYDIYEKTGRSGVMLFLVHRMEFTTQEGVLVSIVDWRLTIRGGLE
jgi:acyl dehydratase